MADGQWIGPDDVERMPSWTQYLAGAVSTLASADDPDDTVFVALTSRELAFVVFMGLVGLRLFPELQPTAARLNTKLRELTEAQEFLPQEGDTSE